MSMLEAVMSREITWGLMIGLLVAGFVWKAGFTAKRVAKKEIKRLEQENKDLQGHLAVQLKINASGNEALQKELESLKTQNENLRVNHAQLQQKPGRAEARQLQVYERAIAAMRVQAPGFAGAWEQAMQRAEEEVASAEGGFSKLLKKVIPGLGGGVVEATKEDGKNLEG